ncbi:MAG: cytochrome B [Gammaproteobacteria bacterium]|nr:MAG: cytochrome B [Gammaproteobacteria bacterium]
MKTQQVRIWDLPTRFFHWTLVVGIIFMWFSAEMSDNLMERHAQVGEFLLSLLLFRVIWGLVGSESSRFTSFIRSPGAVLRYARTLFSRQSSWHAGHNPAGGWMVLVLLTVVLLQAVSGLFASDDIMVEGPLYALVSEDVADVMISIHHLLFNILSVLIALHVAVIVYYRLFKKTDLVPAMVTGSAPWPEHEPVPAPLSFRSSGLAAVIFAACYAAVYFGIRALG